MQAGRTLAAATSLSNGLKSLLGQAADAGGGAELLGVNITADWGHDAYKSRWGRGGARVVACPSPMK